MAIVSRLLLQYWWPLKLCQEKLEKWRKRAPESASPMQDAWWAPSLCCTACAVHPVLEGVALGRSKHVLEWGHEAPVTSGAQAEAGSWGAPEMLRKVPTSGSMPLLITICAGERAWSTSAFFSAPRFGPVLSESEIWRRGHWKRGMDGHSLSEIDFLGPVLGRTDFSRICIFEPPDFFADFVAGFFS